MNKDDVVLLVPGQGAYLPTAVAGLAAARPEVRKIVEEIDAGCLAAGARPVSEALLGTEPPSLDELLRDDPDTLQLALYASNLSVHRVLVDDGVRPAVLIGHSLGEIAALVAAGGFTVSDGARIVVERNRSLHAVPQPGGMTALDIDVQRTRALVDLIDVDELVVAAENAPRQTIISGPLPALETAEAVAASIGLTARRLRSPYAFHSPGLATAAAQLTAAIGGMQRTLQALVYSPILGRAYTDGDDLAVMLGRHLTLPVRFLGALRRLHARGAQLFVECGARATLTGLVRASLPDVTAVASMEGPRDPEGSLTATVQQLLERPGAEPAAAGAEATTAAAPAGQPPVSASGADRNRVLLELRTLYAQSLEYPIDVVAEDLELEADLGVDSLKQAELLRQVADRYGLDATAVGSLQAVDVNTLGGLADLIVNNATPAGSAPRGTSADRS